MKKIIISDKAWKFGRESVKTILSSLISSESPPIITIDYEFIHNYYKVDTGIPEFTFQKVEWETISYGDESTVVFNLPNMNYQKTVLYLDVADYSKSFTQILLRELTKKLTEYDKQIKAVVIICNQCDFSDSLLEIVSVLRVLPFNLADSDIQYILKKQKRRSFIARYKILFVPFLYANGIKKRIVSKLKRLL